MIYAALSEDHRTIEAVYTAPAPNLPDPGPDHGIPLELAEEHERLGDRLVVLDVEPALCERCDGMGAIQRPTPSGAPGRIKDCRTCHGTGTLPPDNLVGSPVVVDDEGVAHVADDRCESCVKPGRRRICSDRYRVLCNGCWRTFLDRTRGAFPRPLGVDKSAAAPSEER